MCKKILFLHGFFYSGRCINATSLKEAMPSIKVITPDLPIHPNEALSLIKEICKRENPDIIVGNSCGAFYAQIIASMFKIPAILGNPHFKMSCFLKERIGSHQYKSPRINGKQDFIIDKRLIDEFKEIEEIQFNYTTNKENIWGLFGEKDTTANFKTIFLEHYYHVYSFPGAHTPTHEEVEKYYAPLIEKMLTKMKISELTSYTPKDISDIDSLMHELSCTSFCNEKILQGIIADNNSHLYIIRDSGKIIGSGCLCIVHTTEFTIGFIEAVIVSKEYRGKGYGKLLMENLIEKAIDFGVSTIHLTSNPKRLEANKLYQSLGFSLYETNYYKKELK